MKNGIGISGRDRAVYPLQQAGAWLAATAFWFCMAQTAGAR